MAATLLNTCLQPAGKGDWWDWRTLAPLELQRLYFVHVLQGISTHKFPSVDAAGGPVGSTACTRECCKQPPCTSHHTASRCLPGKAYICCALSSNHKAGQHHMDACNST